MSSRHKQVAVRRGPSHPGGEGGLHRQALEELAPPSMLVNSEHKVLHLSETAGHFILPSGGALSSLAMNLLRPELRLDVSKGTANCV